MLGSFSGHSSVGSSNIQSMALLLLLLVALSVVTADNHQAANTISATKKISTGMNIDKSSGDDYNKFIKNTRSLLPQILYDELPVLKPLQSQAVTWLDLHLTTATNTITLKIDQRSLYIRGYSTNTTTWEFSESKLIPHSQPLGFSGSYFSAGVARQSLPLGLIPLQNAVATLARTARPTRKQTAKHLVVLSQMVSEAIRIQTVANYIAKYWDNPRPATSVEVNLENTWHTFSSAVQRTNPDASDLTPLPNIGYPNKPDINTIGQAVPVFGILIRLPARTNATSSQSDDGTIYSRTLMNIEDVHVNYDEKISSTVLYGTVTVTNCWDSYVLYDRNSSNYESVATGQSVTLADPFAAIIGTDAFYISVSLSRQNNKFVKGNILWDPRKEDLDFANYDRHLNRVLKGKGGDVTVGFSVIREALSATVDVVLIKASGNSSARLYGSVIAYQFLGGTSANMALWDKSAKEHVVVPLKQSVPLARNVVAASVKLPINIEVSLWNHGTSSKDSEIAVGSVRFDVKLPMQRKTIAGKFGKVEVSIFCQ